MVKGIDNAFDHMELCLVLQIVVIFKWKLVSASQKLILLHLFQWATFCYLLFKQVANRWQTGFSGGKFATCYWKFQNLQEQHSQDSRLKGYRRFSLESWQISWSVMGVVSSLPLVLLLRGTNKYKLSYQSLSGSWKVSYYRKQSSKLS